MERFRRVTQYRFDWFGLKLGPKYGHEFEVGDVAAVMLGGDQYGWSTAYFKIESPRTFKVAIRTFPPGSDPFDFEDSETVYPGKKIAEFSRGHIRWTSR